MALLATLSVCSGGSVSTLGSEYAVSVESVSVSTFIFAKVYIFCGLHFLFELDPRVDPRDAVPKKKKPIL